MQHKLYHAVGSFGMNRATDMTAKAWRELERCRHAVTSDDRRDAAINCAITLWHMIDWVWAAIEAKKGDRLEVAEVLGVKGRKLERNDLVTWALAKCPELAICQGICTGSKHVGADQPRQTGMGAPDPASRPGKQQVATLYVVEDGEQIDAIKVLFEALDFWTYQATQEPVIL